MTRELADNASFSEDDSVTGIPLFLIDDEIQLLLFGGKGGVGKTSCATAAALQMARSRSEDSFLLVSTDPAHSLTDCLADCTVPDNLTVLEFDAEACLSEFNKKHQKKLREIASRGTFLDDEDINGFLDLSLPGLDELMAMLEISGWVRDEKFACIIVDTAPTGHTLRLLAMPESLAQWLDALDALLAKHRYMKKLFSGSYTRDDLDMFLLDLTDSVQGMSALLTDSVRCVFVPVMLADIPSRHESRVLLETLAQAEITVNDVLLNRLSPANDCPICSDRRRRQARQSELIVTSLPGYRFWSIPRYPQEVRGGQALDQFWRGVLALSGSPHSEEIVNGGPVSTYVGDMQESPAIRVPLVKNAALLPPASMKLLFFAGKGGVGKTTLACATAIRLAETYQDKNIFLFSCDPAHSLSVCLDKEIGPAPTPVTARLTAMEIDAQAEFESLKQQYEEELTDFLTSFSPNLDMTFDRAVMERVMALAPPGLDEIMALTRAIDFLSQGTYDMLILDSAPTGHFIRLLEMPLLIDQWLKVFFSLFLKYKKTFNLPNISRRMIAMSKSLKVLRKLLNEPNEAGLYGVTILTEMAYMETEDLAVSCRTLGLNMPLLFLNLVTPEVKCSLCSEVAMDEARITERLTHTFDEAHQTLVYQQGEPIGVEQLGRLGAAIYERRAHA